MLHAVAASFWEELTDPLKVSFDGVNRQIILNPQYSTFNVKTDIYSAWKRWMQRRQNTQFEPALRTIGGDPVGAGIYAGDMYFLINDWQIIVNHPVSVTGILYHDNPVLNPFIIRAGGGVIATVSSLAYAYNTSGVVVPTAIEIRQELDTNSAQLSAIKTQTDAIPAITANIGTINSNLSTISGNISAISNWTGTVDTSLANIEISSGNVDGMTESINSNIAGITAWTANVDSNLATITSWTTTTDSNIANVQSIANTILAVSI